MTVTVFQHVPSEGLGHIAACLDALGLGTRWVRPEDPAPAHDDSAGLIVLGGPMGVADTAAFPRLRDELRAIEHALARGIPMLGVCLGSQLLATVLGAKVAKAREFELGWQEVTRLPAATTDPLFGRLPERFHTLHWHGDAFELPAKTRPLARSALTPHQAYAYGDNAWGILFHLEATAAQVVAMTVANPEEVAEARLTPAVLEAQTAQHAAAGAILAQVAFSAWAQRVVAHK